ncbi:MULTISPECIES: hypothetical protein [Olivibacter]|uniref:Uncharacterized protein n=1 Tax=Olivibacter jilunii TaxID=985016 RepID=A0ABW6B4P1_9SPHI
MNWTQFLLSVAAVYALYYLLNIIFDLLKSRAQSPDEGEQDELVFSEEYQPQEIDTDAPSTSVAQTTDAEPQSRQAISSGPLHTTGGVSIKQLLTLVQDDLIEYTKAIPY